jgi:hypothetical protein
LFKLVLDATVNDRPIGGSRLQAGGALVNPRRKLKGRRYSHMRQFVKKIRGKTIQTSRVVDVFVEITHS